MDRPVTIIRISLNGAFIRTDEKFYPLEFLENPELSGEIVSYSLSHEKQCLIPHFFIIKNKRTPRSSRRPFG
ncbi:MAG: hypothetical protein C4548_01565 [Desulfobacteraceae bacterium]|nr:MAG: hypothetical protein C4548_01565 [Desulfobacteraceae bacterium]